MSFTKTVLRHALGFAPAQAHEIAGVQIKKVCCGAKHVCAIDDKGRIYTIGLNDHWQLGYKEPK
jgi:alpha-tubulin suppressor-like RCC1 family protein